VTDERDEFIASRQKYFDGRQNDRQDAMERRAISQLLTAVGFKGSRKWVFKKGLTWFWTEQYPDMPVPFIARHIEKWSFDELFTRFTKTPVYEAIQDAEDAFDSYRVGAVFHAGRLGEMVIHNMVNASVGKRIVIPCHRDTYIIEPYKGFLVWLLDIWGPMGGPLEA